MDIKELYKEIEASDADDTSKAQLKEHIYLYIQAEQAFSEDRIKDGVSILEMLLERVPDDMNAKIMLAAAYDSAGHPKKSIRLWEEICEAEPEIGDYSLALALLYRRQDRVKKALNQFKTTVDLIPDSRTAWEHLVECSLETEDTHEAKMNCYGAMYLLNEYGIKSIKLNVIAFSFTILEDNDKADKYLESIIDIMRNGEKCKNEYYEGAIHDLLWEIDMAGCYEFMPRIREMVDDLSDISERLAESIKSVEGNEEISAIEEVFPEVLCNIINLLNSKCDCNECKRGIISLECSILVDHDGYRPELIRLSNEHPKLYGLHSEFFDEVVSSVDLDRLLMTRLRILSDDEFEPILIRADGSEINPVVETYRREGRKIGRNELCPCGSGKKYKKCCGGS